MSKIKIKNFKVVHKPSQPPYPDDDEPPDDDPLAFPDEPDDSCVIEPAEPDDSPEIVFVNEFVKPPNFDPNENPIELKIEKSCMW